MRAQIQRLKTWYKALTKRQRYVCWSVAFLFCYTVLGFSIPPLIITKFIPRYANESFLAGNLTIDSAYVNPFSFHGEIKGLKLTDSTQRPVLEVSYASLNIEPLSSLFSWRIVLSEAKTQEPTIHVLLDKQHMPNLLHVLQPQFTSQPTKDQQAPIHLPALDIHTISVKNGTLKFTDQKFSFERAIKNTSFQVNGFSTRPDSDNPMTLTCQTDAGMNIKWEGDVLFNPLSSKGEISVTNFQPGSYHPYYDWLISAELKSASLSSTVKYALAPAADHPTLKIDDCEVLLSDVTVTTPDDPLPLLKTPTVNLKGITLDAVSGEISLDEISIGGDLLHIRRDKDAHINVIKHLIPPALLAALDEKVPDKPANPTDIAPPSNDRPKDLIYALELSIVRLKKVLDLAWKAKLNTLSLHHKRVAFLDEAVGKGASLDIKNINVSLTNLSNASGETASLNSSFDIGAKGKIKLEGKITPIPTKATFNFDVSQVDLAVLSPYLTAFNQTDLPSGTFNTKGNLAAALPDLSTWKPSINNLPQVSLRADTSIHKFTYQALSKTKPIPIVSWDNLTLTGLNATTTPKPQIELKTLAIEKANLHVGLDKDGALSLLKLIPGIDPVILPQGPSKAKPENPTQKTTPHLLASDIALDLPGHAAIGEIEVKNTTLTLTDDAYSRGFHHQYHDINMKLTGLTTKSPQTMDLSVSARDAQGMAMKSTIVIKQPLLKTRTINAKTNITTATMPPYSPLSNKLIAHPMTRGRMNMKKSVQLNGTAITGDISVHLDNLELGKRTKNPDALKLPFKLGLALLKDRDGQIKLPPVSLSGDVTDPSFGIGKVIGYAITNVITKAAAAPFTLIGSMFGGGKSFSQEELSHIHFSPGSDKLAEGENEKLKVIAKALHSRPQLSLVVMPIVLPETESKAAIVRAVEKDIANIQKSPPTDIKSAGIPYRNFNLDSMENKGVDRYDAMAWLFAKQFPEQMPVIIQMHQSFPGDPKNPPKETPDAPLPPNPYDKIYLMLKEAKTLKPDYWQRLTAHRGKVIIDYISSLQSIPANQLRLKELERKKDEVLTIGVRLDLE